MQPCMYAEFRAVHLNLLHIGQLGLHVEDLVDLRFVGGRAGHQAGDGWRRMRQRALERQVLRAPDLCVAGSDQR